MQRALRLRAGVPIEMSVIGRARPHVSQSKRKITVVLTNPETLL